MNGRASHPSPRVGADRNLGIGRDVGPTDLHVHRSPSSAAGDALSAPAYNLEALMHAWERLFVTCAQPHAGQQTDGSYRWVFQPCDRRALRARFAGTQIIAVSCLDACGYGYCWLCLDADAADALEQLAVVQRTLAARGLPTLLEARRRGGVSLAVL
jgi:hypothetical protein